MSSTKLMWFYRELSELTREALAAPMVQLCSLMLYCRCEKSFVRAPEESLSYKDMSDIVEARVRDVAEKYLTEKVYLKTIPSELECLLNDLVKHRHVLSHPFGYDKKFERAQDLLGKKKCAAEPLEFLDKGDLLRKDAFGRWALLWKIRLFCAEQRECQPNDIPVRGETLNAILENTLIPKEYESINCSACTEYLLKYKKKYVHILDGLWDSYLERVSNSRKPPDVCKNWWCPKHKNQSWPPLEILMRNKEK